MISQCEIYLSITGIIIKRNLKYEDGFVWRLNARLESSCPNYLRRIIFDSKYLTYILIKKGIKNTLHRQDVQGAEGSRQESPSCLRSPANKIPSKIQIQFKIPSKIQIQFEIHVISDIWRMQFKTQYKIHIYRSTATDLHGVRRMSWCYKQRKRGSMLQEGELAQDTPGLGGNPAANNQLLRAEKLWFSILSKLSLSFFFIRRPRPILSKIWTICRWRLHRWKDCHNIDWLIQFEIQIWQQKIFESI